MATRTTTLALEVVADLGDAPADFGRIETAAAAAATAVDKMQAATDGASEGIGRVAGAAEGLDSTSAAATGALGALSSGFELVGADKAAAGLQKAAQATDFLSGVGQAAALAQKGQAAATAVLTGAQGALNAVMAANPIALVVLAVVALTAGLVLAYNKSESFRDIVDKAGDVAADAFGLVVDAGQKVADKIGDLVDKAKGLPDGFRDAKDKVAGFMADLLAPIQAVIDKVQGVIDKIKDIKLPDLPDLNPFRLATGGGGYGGGGGFTANGATGGGDDVTRLLRDILATLVAIKSGGSGVADPLSAAAALRQLLARADRIA